MPEEVTLGQEHPTHSPEGWGTGVSCTGRMGILGVSLAWACGEVRGAGQLCLGPAPAPRNRWTLGARHYACWRAWGAEDFHDPSRSCVDVVSEMSMFLGEVHGHSLQATK